MIVPSSRYAPDCLAETLSEHESAVLFSGQFVPRLRIKSVFGSSELANNCLG